MIYTDKQFKEILNNMVYEYSDDTKYLGFIFDNTFFYLQGYYSQYNGSFDVNFFVNNKNTKINDTNYKMLISVLDEKIEEYEN